MNNSQIVPSMAHPLRASQQPSPQEVLNDMRPLANLLTDPAYADLPDEITDVHNSVLGRSAKIKGEFSPDSPAGRSLLKSLADLAALTRCRLADASDEANALRREMNAHANRLIQQLTGAPGEQPIQLQVQERPEQHYAEVIRESPFDPVFRPHIHRLLIDWGRRAGGSDGEELARQLWQRAEGLGCSNGEVMVLLPPVRRRGQGLRASAFPTRSLTRDQPRQLRKGLEAVPGRSAREVG